MFDQRFPSGQTKNQLSASSLRVQGCNVELTEVEMAGHAGKWWTLGYEAFGDLECAPTNLTLTVLPEKPLLLRTIGSGASSVTRRGFGRGERSKGQFTTALIPRRDGRRFRSQKKPPRTRAARAKIAMMPAPAEELVIAFDDLEIPKAAFTCRTKAWGEFG